MHTTSLRLHTAADVWCATTRLWDDDSVPAAGHVLVAGPVPWRPTTCGWVLNLAVSPANQRQGLGRALLDHALQGTRDAGLPALELSVVDGGPGRRLYDAAGFAMTTRVLSLAVPG